MSKRPQTADEILAHFADEALRIYGEQGAALHLCEILGSIMGLLERDRHLLLVTAIRLMTPRERRRWIRYFEFERPDMMGYVMIHNSLLDLFRDIFKKTFDRHVEISQEKRKLMEKVVRRGNCAEVKAKKTRDRNALIDQAIGAGTDRNDAQKIFEFVKQEDATLLRKSKRKNDLIDAKMMMIMYWRSKRGKNNCNRSE
jgi:hypothetical protein